MSTAKRNRKKIEIQQHRQMVYEDALDMLIAGKCTPEYVRERSLKLKEVKK